MEEDGGLNRGREIDGMVVEKSGAEQFVVVSGRRRLFSSLFFFRLTYFPNYLVYFII